MKILKIELQNINSLKSEKPIVIDFTADNFQNIGLFAITGSTGAGKTTILDAISIALYREVPRFNSSSSKASLADVVSYGAPDAFVRLTFENKGVIYEAFWSLRLRMKNGKALSNIVEKLSLKNLTDNKILATSISKVKKEVENILNLNYEQFLRSVMLAQGEFAAFLSAKGNEKGALLEQITGEEIYKRIGEEVGSRISAEYKKLEKIKSEINSEDLLTSEQRHDLEFENKAIIEEIKEIENQIKELQEVELWFVKEAELLETKAQLENKLLELEADKERNKAKIDALEINEKAEDFRELLKEKERLQKAIEDEKTKQESKNKEKLILSSEIEISLKKHENAIELLNSSQELFEQWQPKFSRVDSIDTKLDSVQKSIIDLENRRKNIESQISENEKNIKKSNAVKLKKSDDLDSIKKYLNENKKLTSIAGHITAWNNKLSIRYESNNAFLKNKNEREKQLKLKEENGEKLKNCEQLIKENIEQKESVLKEISDLENGLKGRNTDALYSHKEGLNSDIQEIEKLLKLANDYIDKSSQLDFLDKQTTDDGNNCKKYNKSILELKSKLENDELFLEKLEENYQLKKHIVSLEIEREKLIEGSACPLCGSEEHPAVEEYKAIKLDDTQLEINEFKLKISNIKKSIAEQEKSMDVAFRRLSIGSGKMSILDMEKLAIEKDFSANKFNFEIENIEAINDKKQEVANEILNIDKEIKEINRIGEQLEKVKQKLGKLNDEIAGLRIEEEGLSVKIKSNIDNIANYEYAVKEAVKRVEKIEAELQLAFLDYDLQLPAIDYYSQFISDLQNKISDYNLKKSTGLELESQLSNIEIEIKHFALVLKNKTDDFEKLVTEIEKSRKSFEADKELRNSILPIEISVKSKREDLQSAIKNHTKNVSEIASKHQGLLQEMAKLEADLKTSEGAVNKITKEIEKLISAFESKLQNSGFANELQVRDALLSLEDKNAFVEIRKKIAENEIRIANSITNNEKEIDNHSAKKTFTYSRETSAAELIKKENAKGAKVERVGEIRNKFANDKAIQERNKSVYDRIKTQEKVYDKWKTLQVVLGGSKNSFNVYVQRLTLRNLIALANVHLAKLNNRYSLQMNKTYKDATDALNFGLIDHYQTDQVRFVDTSSGGEKFIISLALALGLSDLASKNVQINSLFIDEGFGTLDNNTLETVISTLETLQSQGKTIGVISHVESLKERIATQIRVIKKSNGVSVVEIV